MGMLSRYQKSGGFLQLLKIIETCGKQKQDNFLSMIEKEDRRWSDALRMKILTVEKILSWPSEPVAEIASRLREVTLAVALHGLTEDNWKKLSHTFSHSQRRKIEDLKNEKKPTPAELSAAFLKIIEEVRGFIAEGYIRPEKFAPELVIDDKIEEKLKDASFNPPPSAESTDTETESAGDGEIPNLDGFGVPSPVEGAAQDIAPMLMKLKTLQKEVQNLKAENKALKEKLGQIKKMAA